MKKKTIHYFFSIFILLIIFVVALISSHRVYGIAMQGFKNLEQKTTTLIRENFGIEFEYNRLSPSIFSGIRISDLKVRDIATKKNIVTIDTLALKWNILYILLKKNNKAFTELYISGVKANYDDLTQGELRNKFASFFSRFESPVKNTEKKIPLDSLSQILFKIPINIEVKDLQLTYGNKIVNSGLEITSFKIKYQNDNTIKLQTGGSLSFLNSNLVFSTQKSLFNGLFSTGFFLQAKIAPDFKDSFAQIRLFSKPDSDFEISRLDIFVGYENEKIQAFLMQVQENFSFSLSSDLFLKKITADFIADNVQLFKIVKPKHLDKSLQNIANSIISGQYHFEYMPDTRSLAYTVQGNVTSKNIFNKNMFLKYDFQGTENTVRFKTLNAHINDLVVDFTGSFDLKQIQAQGKAYIKGSLFPDTETINAEIFIDSYRNETLFFTPQFYIGSKILTGVQLQMINNKSSIDFNFEAYDYSALEKYSKNGVFKASGSYVITGEPFLTLQLSGENLFLDSMTQVIAQFAEKEKKQSLVSVSHTLSPYIFSFDSFFSTNFKTYSYYTPYVVIANTTKDNEVLFISFDGNESVFQMSRFDLLVAGQSIKAELNADISAGKKEQFFSINLFVNSLPYSFSGVFVPGKQLNISGDYNFLLNVDFLQSNGVMAQFSTNALPISYKNFLFSLSFDTELQFYNATDWHCTISRLEVTENSSISAVLPRFVATGKADNYGVFFDKVLYSDSLSTLEGYMSMGIGLIDGILNSLSLDLNLSDQFSPESYSMKMNVFNPDNYSFVDNNFFKNIYFSADAKINASPTGRFMRFQTDANTLTASLSALGSFDNPSISMTIEKSSFSLANDLFSFEGNVNLVDKQIQFEKINAKNSNLTVQDLEGNFFIESFAGQAKAMLSGKLANQEPFNTKTFSSGINMSVDSLCENKNLPFSEKEFAVTVNFVNLQGTFFELRPYYSLQLRRTKGRYDVSLGNKNGVQATLFDYGELTVSAGSDFPVQFNGFGMIKDDFVDVVFENIRADAKSFAKMLDLPVFSLYDGIAEGTARLSGTLVEPRIDGDLIGHNMRIGVPEYVAEDLICQDFIVEIRDSIISTRESKFTGTESGAFASLNADIALEQLGFAYLDLNVHTFGETFVKAHYAMPYASFTGLGQTELSVYVDLDMVEVKGDITVKEAIAEVDVLDKPVTFVPPSVDVIVDLTIGIQDKTRLYIPTKKNPFVRGLVGQDTPLKIQIDSRYGTSAFKGNFSMKGGEVLYLNRTFFVKQASAVLDETIESFDPRLSAVAEIRERDNTGSPIRIILTVENQPLSKLNPRFTSIPSKSEQEIMTLLGKIIIVDTAQTNPLALLGGLADYGAQITVFRSLENTLRDFFKFDIFSFRTMFLQNAFVEAMNYSAGKKQLKVGNFLDNTTVYIGKYFGNTLYADATLHLSYDDRQQLSANKLVLQPEFGIDFPSPFAHIRWSIAPDVRSNWKLLVPYTSISLSWKFNF